MTCEKSRPDTLSTIANDKLLATLARSNKGITDFARSNTGHHLNLLKQTEHTLESQDKLGQLLQAQLNGSQGLESPIQLSPFNRRN